MTICFVKPAAFAALIGIAFGPPPGAGAQPVIPLKEAKLNIEHNATDHDTGFQGAIDSEGWKLLTVTGPDGVVLDFEASGKLRRLGMTELFFETVEPENADVPINKLLSTLPEGHYKISGPVAGAGAGPGITSGTAWLTHDIPAGPVLLSPLEGATVPVADLVMRWTPVTKTIKGTKAKIISYQLIVEKIGPPQRHMIGTIGSLSMHLPPSVTRMTVPRGFLEPAARYDWEVLAIEVSGNQTLSSGKFKTQ
ncbi:MAG: hypothetical protein ACT4SY_00940 [Hyphomicrobiales bacterium]